MKYLKPLGFLLCYFLISPAVFAQKADADLSINKNWKFNYGGTEFAETKDFDDKTWSTVDVPHTWNATDVFDDDLTYARGVAWYRKTVDLTEEQLKNNVDIYFEGVYQVADVYINGAFVGQHKGGYTAFSFDITSKLAVGKNIIAVKVDNTQNPFIPPLSIGYAGYGGIYRSVKLVFSDAVSFNGLYASSGVKIKTTNVETKNATVAIETTIKNASAKSQNITLLHQIYNQENKLVKSISKDLVLASQQVNTISLQETLANPNLWSPESPYLYQVKSVLRVDGKTVAEVKNPLGFRWFSFSPDNGFSLNGSKYILKGTNRHQDMKGKGDALTDADHLQDMKMIKDMGANFLRLAHYPQAPKVLALADSLGLLIWEEIPVVNYMTIAPEFLANAKHMAKEMIYQGYNHPSIVIWGSMNEVLLWGQNAERTSEHSNEKEYVKEVQKYGVSLDSLVRATDPTRYSVNAMHQSKEYDEFNLSKISQISAYNIYAGWYGGEVDDLEGYLNRRHKDHPDQILFVSEYGAGSDGRLNTYKPKRLDFSNQYQLYYHEGYLRQFRKLPFLAGTAVWNQFDFSQPNIGGTIINTNQKGLITFDRKLKDSYFLYQANWAKKPMIHIASKDWTHRAGDEKMLSELVIYSNLKKVTLTLNGKKQGTEATNDVAKAVFNLPLKFGANFIEAVGYQNKIVVKDTLTIYLQPKAIDIKNFSSLMVNIGGNTQYFDSHGQIWVEDQPYQKGQFGHVGGSNVTMNLKKVIRGTSDVPLYYSSLEGLKAYKIDVPDGTFEVTLGFVEQESTDEVDRVFSVMANGKAVITDLNLNQEAGEFKTYQKTFIVQASNNEGISLQFNSKKGESILSSLMVKKVNTANNNNTKTVIN